MLLYGKVPENRRPPRAESETELPLGPDRAESARGFVERTLREWGHGGLVDAASLCTSELVTELAECAPSSLQLVVRDDEDAVLVEVRVNGCGSRFHDLVSERNTQRAASVTVIDETASLWGVAPRASGEAIWFELQA